MFQRSIDLVSFVVSRLAAVLAPEALLAGFGYAAAYALAAFAIELAAVGWKRSAVRHLLVKPSRSALIDVACYALNAVPVLWLIGSAMTLGSLFGLTRVIPVLDIGERAMLPPVVHALLLLVAFDFVEYWFHRLSHQIPALWQLHRFHHAADPMTVLTVSRLHPVEHTLRFTLYIMLGAILGSATIELLPIVYGRAVLGALKHSGVTWRLGWIGSHVVQSPHLHQIHHSIDERHHQKNYGPLFVCWDRLFGTYLDTAEPIVIGIADQDLNRSNFVRDFWICYREFLAQLWLALRPSRATKRPYSRARPRAARVGEAPPAGFEVAR